MVHVVVKFVKIARVEIIPKAIEYPAKILLLLIRLFNNRLGLGIIISRKGRIQSKEDLKCLSPDSSAFVIFLLLTLVRIPGYLRVNLYRLKDYLLW